MGGAGGKDETNETHTLEDEAQTNDPNQAPEKDATQKNKYVALASFLSDLGSRAAFIVPALLNGGTASFGLYLYTIDLMLLAYYAYKGRYCPVCTPTCTYSSKERCSNLVSFLWISYLRRRKDSQQRRNL